MVSGLSLTELFRARDAVVVLKELGFDDDWLLAQEEQIRFELLKRINNPLEEKTNPNVFSKLFSPLGKLLKEL